MHPAVDLLHRLAHPLKILPDFLILPAVPFLYQILQDCHVVLHIMLDRADSVIQMFHLHHRTLHLRDLVLQHDLERASRHDMLSFFHSFFIMKIYLPEFHIEKLLLIITPSVSKNEKHNGLR